MMLGFSSAASAQETILTPLENNVDYSNFPNNAVFELIYEPNQNNPIVEATLRYDLDRFECIPSETSSFVDPTETIGQLTWTWNMNLTGSPPPGTTVRWYWELLMQDDSIQRTTEQTIVLEDSIHEWKQISAENITLNWYEGSDTMAEELLDSAVNALNRIETDIEIEITDPITFYIYGSGAEMRDAVAITQEWAGGLAFSDYDTILIGIDPNSADDWGVRAIAHELAHLVVGEYGRSCIGGFRPNWLEEGLAVYAEGELEEDFANQIKEAIKDDTFVPLRSLTGSFPAHDSGARLAYSQSASVVQYMIEQYGADKMQQFLRSIADGDDQEQRLVELYGTNIDGLENEWRVWLGIPERVPLPTLTPINPSLIPTMQLQDVSEDMATPDGGIPDATYVPPLRDITVNDQTGEVVQENQPDTLSPEYITMLLCCGLELLLGGWLIWWWLKKRKKRLARKKESQWKPEDYL